MTRTLRSIADVVVLLSFMSAWADRSKAQQTTTFVEALATFLQECRLMDERNELAAQTIAKRGSE